MGIICLVWLLGLAPFLAGQILGDWLKIQKNGILRYLLGVTAIYTGFTVLCLLFEFRRWPFHILTIAFSIVLFLVTVFGGWLWYQKKDRKQKRKWQRFSLVQILMGSVVAGQTFRLFVMQTFSYRDSKTYNTLVNDIVSLDRIYGLSDATGEKMEKLAEIDIKYLLSSWYPYEAFLSKCSGIHPLILCNTILPPLILLMEYMILWLLGDWLFRANRRKQAGFVLICALLQESTYTFTDQATIAMMWPTWGKNLVAVILLPLILYVFTGCIETGKIRRQEGIVLFLLDFTACAVSTMGLMAASLEIGLFLLLMIWHNKNIKDMWPGMVALIPSLFYMGLYFWISSGRMTIGV